MQVMLLYPPNVRERLSPCERSPTSSIPMTSFLVRVRHNGEFRSKGRRIYLSEALARQTIGLKPRGHDLFEIFFSTLPLACSMNASDESFALTEKQNSDTTSVTLVPGCKRYLCAPLSANMTETLTPLGITVGRWRFNHGNTERNDDIEWSPWLGAGG